MDMMERWEKALKKTEIIRSRIQPLKTFETTRLPYIFLSESAVNIGDTVVRKGEISVDKPSLIMPENIPHFEGFEFEEESEPGEDMVINFLLVRGIRFPSYNYNNQTISLDIHEGKMSNAISHFSDILQKEENVHAGLVTGPEDCWQFSVLIFICSMVARSSDADIRKLLDNIEKKKRMS